MDKNRIIDIEKILRMREKGKKPATVFLLVDAEAAVGSLDLCIPAGANVERLDFRPLVGMSVILLAGTADERVRRIFRRLCSFADWVFVSFADQLPERLGWVFERGQGIRDFGVPHQEAA